MAQVLSQDEVDALLKAVNDESGDSPSLELVQEAETSYAEVEETDASIQPYDLANQDRVIRGRMPIL
ncbi:MAG TPA: hypothetical protein VKY27_03715, partial [Bacteriovoracaceae bacterium]|nr:hypothetical protein [Bacteriovoracaceae bacterium]